MKKKQNSASEQNQKNASVSHSEWEDCPNCPNQGFTVEPTQQRYITRDMAIDAEMPELEGQLYCNDEFEQVQCEFCWCNEKSVYYQKNELWKKAT